MAARSVSYGRTLISQERPSYETSTEYSLSGDDIAILLCCCICIGDALFFIDGVNASTETSNKKVIKSSGVSNESRKDLSEPPEGTIVCCLLCVFVVDRSRRQHRKKLKM